MSTISHDLARELQDLDLKIHKDYEGRYMFGRTCLHRARSERRCSRRVPRNLEQSSKGQHGLGLHRVFPGLSMA